MADKVSVILPLQRRTKCLKNIKKGNKDAEMPKTKLQAPVTVVYRKMNVEKQHNGRKNTKQALTYFKLIFRLYIPWKRQKNSGFLRFSGCIEMVTEEWKWKHVSDSYSEPCQKFKIERFMKIVKALNL